MAVIGTIALWSFDWAPRGWVFCHGQSLDVAKYQPLFSLLQYTYGGNGYNSFCLPDLRGRVPLGAGHADGLSNYKLGTLGGIEKVSLSTAEMPTHNHSTKLQAASPVERGTETPEVTNNYLATGNKYASKANNSMAPDVIQMEATGNGDAHENRQPFLTLNYIICTKGEFPERP